MSDKVKLNCFRIKNSKKLEGKISKGWVSAKSVEKHQKEFRQKRKEENIAKYSCNEHLAKARAVFKARLEATKEEREAKRLAKKQALEAKRLEAETKKEAKKLEKEAKKLQQEKEKNERAKLKAQLSKEGRKILAEAKQKEYDDKIIEDVYKHLDGSVSKAQIKSFIASRTATGVRITQNKYGNDICKLADSDAIKKEMTRLKYKDVAFDLMNVILEYIRAYGHCDLTHGSLAKKIGVSPQTVYNWISKLRLDKIIDTCVVKKRGFYYSILSIYINSKYLNCNEALLIASEIERESKRNIDNYTRNNNHSNHIWEEANIKNKSCLETNAKTEKITKNRDFTNGYATEKSKGNNKSSNFNELREAKANNFRYGKRVGSNPLEQKVEIEGGAEKEERIIQEVLEHYNKEYSCCVALTPTLARLIYAGFKYKFKKKQNFLAYISSFKDTVVRNALSFFRWILNFHQINQWIINGCKWIKETIKKTFKSPDTVEKELTEEEKRERQIKEYRATFDEIKTYCPETCTLDRLNKAVSTNDTYDLQQELEREAKENGGYQLVSFKIEYSIAKLIKDKQLHFVLDDDQIKNTLSSKRNKPQALEKQPKHENKLIKDCCQSVLFGPTRSKLKKERTTADGFKEKKQKIIEQWKAILKC